jgi:hypothetical protein
MKKIALLLAVLFAFGVAGCGEKDGEKKEETKKEKKEEKKEEKK